jgi:hypothetical protein
VVFLHKNCHFSRNLNENPWLYLNTYWFCLNTFIIKRFLLSQSSYSFLQKVYFYGSKKVHWCSMEFNWKYLLPTYRKTKLDPTVGVWFTFKNKTVPIILNSIHNNPFAHITYDKLDFHFPTLFSTLELLNPSTLSLADATAKHHRSAENLKRKLREVHTSSDGLTRISRNFEPMDFSIMILQKVLWKHGNNILHSLKYISFLRKILSYLFY